MSECECVCERERVCVYSILPITQINQTGSKQCVYCKDLCKQIM